MLAWRAVGASTCRQCLLVNQVMLGASHLIMAMQGASPSTTVYRCSCSSVSVHRLPGARVAHRGGASVYAALRLGLRHALHAVHAALVLELAVHRRAAHLQAVLSTLKLRLARTAAMLAQESRLARSPWK